MFKGARMFRRGASNWSKGRGTAQVLVSTSYDVHRNLALEEWFYSSHDWSVRPPLLLLWRNSPCVVIGRHQNPWLECRLSSMAEHGVVVARRNSGGGTVYHDLGNLNCTFFTSRSDYDRLSNLQLVCGALRSRYPGLDVRVSSRHDILLDNKYKISGTASKLGRGGAYHHCTVLFDVSTHTLSSVLRSADIPGVESKATRSIKSVVKNLPGVCCDELVGVIRSHYLLFHGVADELPIEVDPEEVQFPGVDEIAERYESWDWIFGRCPAFEVEREFALPPELSSRVGTKHVALKVGVKHGLIESVRAEPDSWLGGTSETVPSQFVGLEFPTVLLPLKTEPIVCWQTNLIRTMMNDILADLL